MPMKLYMDKHQARLGLLKILALTLAGTTWVFCSFIFSTRPEESVSDPLTALVRLPASLPSQIPTTLPEVFQPPVRVVEPIAMEVLQVPCWDKGKVGANETAAHFIRLMGRNCMGPSEARGDEKVTVLNLTTGYSATVFATQGRDLTTDFIPLVIGQNDIVIRIEQGPGAMLESRVAMLRQSSAQ